MVDGVAYFRTDVNYRGSSARISGLLSAEDRFRDLVIVL